MHTSIGLQDYVRGRGFRSIHWDRNVRVPPIGLAGTLNVPASGHGLVAFAHGSCSSRFSPRNNVVAEALNAGGIATLLFDLLTTDQERNRANIFNIPLLPERLVDAVRRLDHQPPVRGLPLGLFGASTGVAAALMAVARLGNRAAAIVSRGGRPDLAGDALDMVRIPTLLIAGGDDLLVIDLNRLALECLEGPKALEIVSGASHLFAERGALESVVEHARNWLNDTFATRRSRPHKASTGGNDAIQRSIGGRAEACQSARRLQV